MKLEDWLIDKIIDTKIHVVAIGGAADLGKSYLAEQLVGKCEREGVSATCLGLDSYLLPRDVRVKRELSGYDPRSHDLDNAKRDIERLLSGETIDYYEYMHDTGRRAERPISLEPASRIIVEGLHSMHPLIAPFVDFSIFIFTSDKLLCRIRGEADLRKRKLTEIEADRHERRELEHYYKYVHSYKDSCDVRLYLDRRWHYQFLDV